MAAYNSLTKQTTVRVTAEIEVDVIDNFFSGQVTLQEAFDKARDSVHERLRAVSGARVVSWRMRAIVVESQKETPAATASGDAV